MIRWLIFFTFKKTLCEITEESKNFWGISDVDPDDQSGAAATMKSVFKGMKVYAFAVFITGTGVVFSSIAFGWGEVLPFTAWYPRDQPYGYEVQNEYLLGKRKSYFIRRLFMLGRPFLYTP